MYRDQEIYQDIAQILIDNNYYGNDGIPLDSKIIKMKAELVIENDVCHFEFNVVIDVDLINFSGLNGVGCAKIHDLLVELRKFYLDNNQPYWKGCNFEVNLETGKIGVEFIYD